MKNSFLEVIVNLNPIDIFCNNKIESIIASIENEVRSVVTSTDTKKEREAISSLAYKISRSKTAYDNIGKSLCAEWKKKSKNVDIERKKMRERMDSLRDEVRAPLVEWEAIEQKKKDDAERVKKLEEEAEIKRIENIKSVITEISELTNDLLCSNSETIYLKLGMATEFLDDFDFEEFTEQAKEMQNKVVNNLRAAYDERLAFEKKAAEQAERENKIAEQQARIDRQKEEIYAEKERLDIEKREEEIRKESAAQAKIEAEKAAQEKIDKSNLAAERAKEAAEKTTRDAAQAIENEKKRADETEARVKREAAEAEAKIKREADEMAADKNHRIAVNNQAVADLVANGISKKMSIEIITIISKRKIFNVSIKY